MPLPIEHIAALEKMFKAIAPSKCERWRYLLDRRPSRWSKISPIDAWPLDSAFDSYPNEPISKLLARPSLAQSMNNSVLVLRCGHSTNPGVSVMLLKDVFPNGEWADYNIIFEGFVCVIPGKVAIATNHEGGVYVYGV